MLTEMMRIFCMISALCMALLAVKSNAGCSSAFDFEGLYDIVFDCVATHNCPDSVLNLNSIVIIETSSPDLLGTGLGLVVSVVTKEVAPGFFFTNSKYNAERNDIIASSDGGRRSQAGQLLLSTKTKAGENFLVGSLRDLNSPTNMHFKAIPVHTVGGDFADNPNFNINVNEVEGLDQGNWASTAGTMMVKAFKITDVGADYSARFQDSGRVFREDFHSGSVSSKKGVLNLVADGGGLPSKLFLAYQGNREAGWSGFSVSSRTAKMSAAKFKKIQDVDP